jgi:predicted aspartyl protease
MTAPGTVEMGRVTAEIELANYEDVILAQNGLLAKEKIRRARVDGIVDTGAAKLVLPQIVVDQLGLQASSTAGVRYADHRTATRDIVQNVWLELCKRPGVFSAIVEPNRPDALIGAIVMEELDLIVDCTHNTVHPRDPKMIISEIE